MIRVGVIGAYGRMGREVCKAVAEDPELALVAAVDTAGCGENIGPLIGHPEQNLEISEELDALTDAEVDVAVDFTHPDAVLEDIDWCVRHAIHIVVGTTGISQADLDKVLALLEEEGNESNVFVAPNFAIGAVLMMRFAAQASRWMPSAEIIELHHDGKADAPSGTAMKTAEEIAKARPEGGQAKPSKEIAQGARGGEIGGIHVHSVRLPGLVAHQEVILGGPGQSLTIRHDSYDRASFMPGVVLAVKNIAKRPGLTYGLVNLLDL